MLSGVWGDWYGSLPEKLRRLAAGGKLSFVFRLSGSSSAVERQLPKLDVAGSIPVSRSINSTA